MNTPPATQQDLLDLLTRTTDPGWLSGMLNQPDGHAIVNAWLAIFAQASVAVSGQVDCSMIATAPTGAPGNCTLTLQRTTTGTTGTIPKGYTFVTNLLTSLVVETDTPIGSGQTSVAIPLVTVRQIDLVNTVVPAFDDLLTVGAYPDAILGTGNPSPPLDSSGNALLGGTHVAGYSLTYVSSSPITGASSDWLSAHGAERSCYRQQGEDGESYRARVRLIPDAVSPNAVARAVDGPANVLPTRWLAEPFNDGADPDVRLALNLGWFDSFFWDVDFLDDWLGVPASGAAIGKRPIATLETPGMRESRAYVRLDLVGDLTDPDGFLWYWDAGYFDDTAWGFFDVGVPVVGSGLGAHPVIGAVSDAMLAELRAKLAGGVQSDVYLEDSTQLQARNGVLSNTYYLQADGSLASTPPGTSGDLAYLIPGGGTVAVSMQSGAIGQTTWPGGTIPLTVWAWVTGGAGNYTFGLVGGEAICLDRGYSGGGGSAYMYSDHGNVPPLQSITNTPTLFTFSIPVLATTGALVTDYLALVLNVFGSPGATLHIGYGATHPLTIPTLFPLGSGASVAWTLTPTAGTTWMLREGLVTGDDGAPLAAGQGVAVKFTFADATTLQTPWAAGVLSLRSYELQALGYYGQPITQIQGLGMSTLPGILNVVGSFAVSTMTT